MTGPIRVLHLEDNSRDAEIIQDVLVGGAVRCDIVLANSRDTFEAALMRQSFDLIITDFNLPGYDGISALRRAQEQQPETPVIVISGSLGEEEAVKCLHTGATDYLLKGRLERLVPAVRRAIQEAEGQRERKRAGEALQTAEERVRFALEAAGVGIWDLDCATGTLRWSAILEAHYGLRPGTFGGTLEAFEERIHPDDRASVLETFGKAMKSGADFSSENRSIWPDGTVRWLSGAGRIFLGERGEPFRGVGISQDVTERKRAEAERKRLSEEIHLQRLRVFKATMSTVQDIINNFLNGLLLIHLEAQDQLPPDVQTLVDQLIREAAMKLRALGNLETVEEKELATGILGIDYPATRLETRIPVEGLEPHIDKAR